MTETPVSPTNKRRGAFSMPKNPGAALQELMTEERQQSSVPALPPNDAQMRKEADARVLAEARTGASAPLITQGSDQGSTPAITEALTDSLKEGSTHASESAADSNGQQALQQSLQQEAATADLVAIVRERLLQKRNHPGGTKASVDMSPELSLRLKRYLLDHGNPPLRILALELLTAFVDAEGY